MRELLRADILAHDGQQHAALRAVYCSRARDDQVDGEFNATLARAAIGFANAACCASIAGSAPARASIKHVIACCTVGPPGDA